MTLSLAIYLQRDLKIIKEIFYYFFFNKQLMMSRLLITTIRFHLNNGSS